MRHDFLKKSFFPSTVIEWNKIEKNIRKSESFNIFKKSILKFIRPSPNRVYNCHNPKGIKSLTRLSVGLSHLREQKFKYSFQDTLNPICNCSEDIETTSHYIIFLLFLGCTFFYISYVYFFVPRYITTYICIPGDCKFFCLMCRC